ncbi:arginine/serine-rich protein 1 [Halichoeres trimaculatus]|uniref:arginine/serine-rich protein 1 n=1 Tax=Halichoeres trimaculatus TaxID=147232 RepID=UPI003D9F49E6
MAKEKGQHSEMAHARRSDGINVIFDKNSLDSSGSRSGSRRSRSPDSGHNKRRYRSSSSSSSSSSSTASSPSSGISSRSRSRSHPRCYRRSSRCRCSGHFRYGRGRHSRSPPRRYRAQSRSFSRSPTPDRYSRRRRSRSRSRSPRRWNRHSRPVSQSFKTYRSRSRSSERSGSLTLYDKKELLKIAKDNAMKILGVERLDLPKSVEPILSEPSESKWSSPEPWLSVKQPPTKTCPQSSVEDPEHVPSPKLSPKGKISFSINNSVVKPTVAATSCAKVTPRVDSYESRKPYGRWVPVKSGRSSNAR